MSANGTERTARWLGVFASNWPDVDSESPGAAKRKRFL